MKSFFSNSLGKLLICILLAVVVWHFDGIINMPKDAWHVFAVFLAVILSFILRPYSMGFCVLLGLISLVILGSVTLNQALSGFADTTVWLVIVAFLLAQAVVDTGFGKRLALLLVVRLGKTVKGLAYAICGSEFILGSVMPSNTARGGGIHAPIVNSLSHSLDSTASHNPERAGQYLTLVGAHANLIVSAMFMTGMAANPLVTKAAKDIFQVDFGWGMWILGSIVPGAISLLLLPQLLYYIAKPTVSEGQEARQSAKAELVEMGPMHWKEKLMLAVLIVMLILWSTKFIHGLGTTLVAFIGLLVLLLTKAYSWDKVVKNDRAWDALIWLGGLVTLATMLLEYGFIDWFVNNLKGIVTGFPGLMVVLVLGLFYFYSMYAFSMLTAHIAAMVAPFFAVCLSAGTEPMLAVAVFAYFSCLCGCMTNYSTGPIIIYFGLGYVKAPKWFSLGFVISIFHLVIWIPIGLVWWKILGWW